MKDRLKAIYNKLKKMNAVSTQSEFSEKLGYRNTYMSAFMNGHEDISDKLIAKLESVFRVNQKYIRTGEGSMFITPNTNNLGHNQDEKAESFEPSEQSNVNEMLLTSLPPINQGDANMNTLLSMQRTQENYSIAEVNRSEAAKNQSEAAKVTAKTQLILAELLQLRFGEDGLKKAVGK